MGIFIFKLYNDKKIIINEVHDLNDQLKKSENTIAYSSNTNIVAEEKIENIENISGSPEGLLVKLGLANYGQYNNKTNDNYIKTNIKYSDYKNQMLDYMTEEWFENNFTKSYKNVNGYLYFFDGGATGMNFEVESVNIKGDYSNLNYITNVYNISVDDSKELEYVEFHITNYNEQCVISYCDY